jgi:hypothetical protein
MQKAWRAEEDIEFWRESKMEENPDVGRRVIINIDLQEIERGIDFIYLAQDRDQ